MEPDTNARERRRIRQATVATTATATPTGHRARPRRLGARTRKAFLLIHIASAGAWIGIDVVMAVLVFTGFLTDDRDTAAIAFQALELTTVWPLLTTGLICLVSGVVLGLGTKYGLVTYWWVAIKLVLNIVLTALVLLSLRGGVADVAEYGRQLAEGSGAGSPTTDMLYPPIVSPTALMIALLLAVYKPWGLIRKRRA
ncbi:hypothetical protein ABN028_10630 [Actinopolymorpha sp. B17G11]|uniref:hypothetical protein n=1 Tax=Actinopolymorpha sp. B17G11 TaxID=3160861 RepID=UPI0032E44E48